jgi:hypothetical protein
VDNDGKTISDRNDQYRNEKVCKQLKDKYSLTNGKGKENVNVQKLKGAEQTKYEIYHAIKEALPKAKSWQVFEEALKQKGISIEYKYKGQTNEVQGISFKKREFSFKGSEIDRKFSYSKLDAQLNENSHSQEQQQEQQISIPKETGSPILENIAFGVADAVSSIGGLLEIQPSNYDMNEAEALLRKKKKGKIKKPRL